MGAWEAGGWCVYQLWDGPRGLGEGNEETDQGPQNKGPPGVSESPWDTIPPFGKVLFQTRRQLGNSGWKA